jgi:hypothetical protein
LRHAIKLFLATFLLFIRLNDKNRIKQQINISRKMKRKTIILAMSCNQQFFQDEEHAIRTRGYARYVLEERFSGVEFWTYTASLDGKYHINKREHKLSVPTGDGLYDTFEKTKAAF